MVNYANNETDSNDAQSNLNRIKENIRNSYTYFRENNERFHDFTKFTYKSTLSSEDIAVLNETQKPVIEFNIVEAYVSRVAGEFSKYEPSVECKQEPLSKVEPAMMEIVEGHCRYITETEDPGYRYHTFCDMIVGGFSATKIFTEYSSPMSFEQVIKAERVFDPTLCGYDPMAREVHKGDGEYCFEIIPLSEEDAKRRGINPQKFKFTRSFEGMSWSYQNGTEKIIVLATYFEKKHKKVRIVKLANGDIMRLSEYNKMLKNWESLGIIEQPPAIVGKPRTTDIVTICRYVLTENEIIEEDETDFDFLPIIFFDGNSRMVRDAPGGSIRQYTRPYIYNAKGIQKLKNFAGQCLANELENLIQHKFIIPKEGIPDKYLDAYENIQKANVVVYNAFQDDDPDRPLPPPREVVRTPIPPEITNTFRLSDELTQMILGSFDAGMAQMPNGAVSGIAIQESMSLSNQGVMPYVVNFMLGYTRVLQCIVNLLPKYYPTPRTLPIVNREGKHEYVQLSEDENLNYNSDAIQVDVKAGLNFSAQKSKALNEVIQLSQASPAFGQFMAAEGLEVIMDNIEIRGAEMLKAKSEEYMKKIQQQQQAEMQAAQQQAQQPDPAMMAMQIKQQEIQQKMEKDRLDAEIKQKELMYRMEQDMLNLEIRMIELKQKEEQMKNERIEMLGNLKIAEERHATEVYASDSDREIEMMKLQAQRDKSRSEVKTAQLQ